MSTTSILVADEDNQRAGDLAARVRGDAWEVAIAANAEAARRAIEERPISLLLADASVWHKDGLGQFVTEHHAAMPVIVLTPGDESAGGLIGHLKLGAMTYVPRHSGRRRLVETIQSILDIARRNPYRDRVRGYLRQADIDLEISNTPSEVAVVVGYLQRVLEDYGLTETRECFRIGVALSEAVSNGIIHGNLEVESELRESGSDAYYEAIEARRNVEPYASRRVQVHARFSRSTATFLVRDQGRGFDPKSIADPTDPENLARASGRGILLMKAYADLVSWNEAGNEVTLVKSITA